MTTVWERRDLPLLQALATSDDPRLRHGYLYLWGDDQTPLGLPFEADELHDAILTLTDAELVEGSPHYETGPGASFTRFRVTGRGQQVLGQWPGFVDVSPLTMAALLDRLAEQAATEEERTNARRAAEYVRSLRSGAFRAAATAAMSQLARIAVGL